MDVGELLLATINTIKTQKKQSGVQGFSIAKTIVTENNKQKRG